MADTARREPTWFRVSLTVSSSLTRADDFARFVDCPVLVVGDVMLDEFVWGRVNRISPEAPVPVVEVERRSFAAGGAANTAANIATLGGRASLAGIIGTDAAGDRIIEALSAKSVNHSPLVRCESRLTTVKTRIVAHHQQVARIDQETKTALDDAIAERLLNVVIREVKFARSVIISDYGKGVITPNLMTTFLAAARAANVPVIVDPKGTDYVKYRGVTLVKPNQAEAGKVLNRDLTTNEEVERAGADLLDLLGGETAVLITRGPQGMSLFERGKPPVLIPTHAREVYDVTGAGDTVAGTLALALAAGVPLPRACEYASRAAAIVVQKIGTATLTRDELAAAIASEP